MEAITQTYSERTFGLELEVISPISEDETVRRLNAAGVLSVHEHYNHQTRPHWKVVHDVSVRANSAQVRRGLRHDFEIVSPVLSGAEGLAEVRKVCELLNEWGFEVNVTCGLHVHHGAGDFQGRDFVNLVRTYRRHEADFDALVPPSRRGNAGRWCQSLQGRTVSTSGDRYMKLNLTSFHRHGTVEVRHFGGSIDPNKVCGWIVLTQKLVEAVRSLRKEVSEGASTMTFAEGLKIKKDQNRRASEDVLALNAQIAQWVKDRKTQLKTNRRSRRAA